MLHKIFEGLPPDIRISLERRLYSMLIDISDENIADIRSILKLAKALQKELK